MSNKFHVGLDVTGFTNNGARKPISRVTLYVDDSNAITAGDDTGCELVADCPFATQEMVDAILAQVNGHVYQAYSAEDANIDPAAELGDGITVGGVYSVISRFNDDGSGYVGVDAPGEAELEDEYPSAGPMTREFNHKIAQTRSQILKTAESITLQVEGVEDECSYLQLSLDGLTTRVQDAEGNISRAEQTAQNLTTRVESAEGDISSLEQSVGSITLSVSNKTSSSVISLLIDGVEVASKTIRFTGDVVFESDLEDGTTTVSGDCITTGQILAEFLALYGEMAVYEDDSLSDRGGYIGFCDGASGDPGIGFMYSSSRGQVICTSAGARMAYGDYTTLSCTKSNIAASQPISEGSDRRIKNSFVYDLPETYEAMYKALKPCRFKRNDGQSGRYHTGFVAQEIEDAVLAGGLKSTDFAAYCIDDSEEKKYSVRYTELIALNTAFVQKLMNRVDELEKRVKQLEGGSVNG